VGGPTCQTLPAAFPGYAPYCPYSARSAPGRGWTAPDLDRARGLIAHSGRAGERVILHAPDYDAPLARYYAGLLRELGFRTTLRIQPGDAYDVYDPATRATTGFGGWAADYLGPSNFLLPIYGCRSASNLSRLCDRTLERLDARALAAPPTDAATAWARADRRVVDLAAGAPLTNRRSVVLVSKRVGNVRSHPLLFTMLDQMWVR
jgi:peptide/nickel transport system substrate-binding protein